MFGRVGIGGVHRRAHLSPSDIDGRKTKRRTEKFFATRDWPNLLDDEKFTEQVLKDVQKACRKGGIERFETAQRLKIVSEAWTAADSGFVTDARKLKRKAIEDLSQDKLKKSSLTKIKSSRVAPAPEQPRRTTTEDETFLEKKSE